ncbi:hypothetical protein PR202_gb20747 [Eleusine coracana subsp. coracana]|uniref:Plastid lipid-associated protein/fibrillin conserved domain-containing protein n=1 Tax=Eleusine coracana subsp. coracana TaxID=191504 RepID=A0AAV5FB94_ELECO|nr:hypothetical protein PR202_gb20747 [Eleusine coracana subsp. coracana]
MATIAASTGTGTGGFIHLRPSHLPPHPRSASPCFTASRSPCRFWSQSLPRARLRRAPLPASASVAAAEAAYTEPEAALLEALLGEVESAVQALEAIGGVPDPRTQFIISSRLLQRTFVGVDSFRIFQEVYLRTDDPRVVNVVRFSESVGDLRVEAEATIEDGKRILFRFDRAAFTFKFLPFKVPYPVPFRLLGDEAKGWLDTTYLSPSGNIRISRGNKAEDQNWSSIASAGLKGFQIIEKDGQLKNLMSPLPGVNLNASGNICKKDNSNTFSVSMKDGAIQVGGVQFPLDVQGELVMEILYVDNKIKISRLNQHMLVHLRIGTT